MGDIQIIIMGSQHFSKMLCSSDLNIFLDLYRNEIGISFQILAPSLENALSWICNLDGFI